MCTRPNYMIHDGTFTKNERPHFKFLGHHQFDDILKKQKEFNLPYIQVPCGQCLECRIQHARQWADRCVLEAKQYKDNYFVTLTYDDEHLPERNSLNPKDLTLFLKRLRKRFKGIKIRFLACGEYGDASFRPHYHLCLFNLPLNDLSYTFELIDNSLDVEVFKEKPHFVKHLRPNNKGDLLYSRLIYECWQYKGMISVARFNYDTAAYVSQYVTKKVNPKQAQLYKELNIVPEFLRMSNRPGIGAAYFHQKDTELHAQGSMIIPQDGEAHVSSIPRYFDKLFIAKYGEDVFLPVRQKRYKKKMVNAETYEHSKRRYDDECNLRDYKLHKRQLLRNSI